MNGAKILWVDDEIDLLKVHIYFLEEKGHTVEAINNGEDAIDTLKEQNFDIIFLDENMPGKSGLDVLPLIRQTKPNIPIVMITKNEEEQVMDEAIGSSVAGYLIKPVNPNQILLSIKKNVQNTRLINEKTTAHYQAEFRNISIEINEAKSENDWNNIYKKIIFWENKLENLQNSMMDEILQTQKEDANSNFAKYIEKNYIKWFSPDNENRPKMLFDVVRKDIIPLLDKKEKLCVIVIDNLRFDQWKTIEPLITRHFEVEKEEIILSMLPTSTQYARNAFFAGLTPLEISKRYPDYWLNDKEDGGKNMHEEDLLHELFNRYRRKIKFNYHKVLNNSYGEKVNSQFKNMIQDQLSVIVYNFVDILSHARTDSKMIRELASDEAAYKSLTLTWFEHSPLLELFKMLSENKIKTIITTDHGSIKVNNAVKVVGDRETTTNLRYKQGRNLSYKKNQVFEITKPEKVGLPSTNLSSTYIFAYKNDFLAYPNNYNYYVKYYKDTFQHGGISLEELLIPLVTLTPK